MLGLIQNNNRFDYLHWTLTDIGPEVNSFGSVIIDENKTLSVYSQLLSKIKKTVKDKDNFFSLTLNDSSIYFSELQDSDQIGSDEMINWYIAQNDLSSIKEIYDIYNYSFSKGSKLLNVFVPKEIKVNLLVSLEKNGGMINSLSTGIFSAEVGARKWFSAQKLKSYAVWKVCSNKLHELLFVYKNDLKLFVKFKQFKNSFKIVNYYGELELQDYILSQIESMVFLNKYKFDFCSEIFIYSEKEQGLIENCLGQKKHQNITILNPLSSLSVNKNLDYNFKDTSYLAESGNCFKDIDV